jgi:outer membrane protein assembly factor BamD (BamD/ComL family)
MKSMLGTLLIVATLSAVRAPSALCQNPELARDLAEEGVYTEAKIEFIKVLHDPSQKPSYDVAEYYLGYLSSKEQNYERALRHWNILLKEHSASPYTVKAKQQIQVAYQLLAKQQAVASENLEISSLFENADFLIDQPLKVSIDTSYLSHGDLAIEWLEQVVTRFPQSPDASRALFREALVYYGWGKEGIGQYSRAEGYGFEFFRYYARNKGQAQAYIDKMINVLSRLQKDYPDSPYAIPVSYLIGQAYWSAAGGKTDDNARLYWNKVITLAGDDKANAYRQIAEWRLK